MRGVAALLLAVLVYLICVPDAYANQQDTQAAVCSVEKFERVDYLKSSGQDVAQFQAALRLLGYDIEVDGVFGPETLNKGLVPFYADHLSGARHGPYLGPLGRERLAELVQQVCTLHTVTPQAKSVVETQAKEPQVADKAVLGTETVFKAPKPRPSRDVVAQTPPAKAEAADAMSAIKATPPRPTRVVSSSQNEEVAKPAFFIDGHPVSEVPTEHATDQVAAVIERPAARPRAPPCKPGDETCRLNSLHLEEARLNSTGNCTGEGCAPLRVEHAIVKGILALGATCTESQLVGVYRDLGLSFVRADLVVGCAQAVFDQSRQQTLQRLVFVTDVKAGRVKEIQSNRSQYPGECRSGSCYNET